MDLMYRSAISDNREDTYLQRIQVYDRHSRKNAIGALLVERGRIREGSKAENFYQYMRRYSPGLGKLALALFNRYGCLLDKFKTHTISKGYGVFQEELRCGDILFIEHISVADDQTTVESGSTLVAALLKHIHECC